MIGAGGADRAQRRLAGIGRRTGDREDRQHAMTGRGPQQRARCTACLPGSDAKRRSPRSVGVELLDGHHDPRRVEADFSGHENLGGNLVVRHSRVANDALLVRPDDQVMLHRWQLKVGARSGAIATTMPSMRSNRPEGCCSTQARNSSRVMGVSGS
jgi:hypothetical protein